MRQLDLIEMLESKEPKRLAVDVDDVLANFVPRFIEEYNSRHGTKHRFIDTWCYDLSKCMHQPPEKIQDVMLQMNIEGVFANLERIPYAAWYMNQLKADGHYIDIVTNRSCASDTVDWLNNNGIPYDKVWLTKHKASLMKKLGTDYFIDDCAENVEEAVKEGINCIVPNKPWNQTAYPRDLVTRVRDWHDIYRHIRHNTSPVFYDGTCADDFLAEMNYPTEKDK